jgi:hypothetical protein
MTDEQRASKRAIAEAVEQYRKVVYLTYDVDAAHDKLGRMVSDLDDQAMPFYVTLTNQIDAVAENAQYRGKSARNRFRADVRKVGRGPYD